MQKILLSYYENPTISEVAREVGVTRDTAYKCLEGFIPQTQRANNNNGNKGMAWEFSKYTVIIVGQGNDVNTILPSTPTKRQATAIFNTKMKLSWNASTDKQVAESTFNPIINNPCFYTFNFEMV